MSEPRTVLVVDDERNMLMVMQMTLEEAGYRVLTADRGDDAVGLLRDPDLAVVLSDLKMPGMGGGELIARVQRERPDVPVIVVTAFGSIRSAVECLQAGASDYLTKPFEPEELQFAVQSAVRLHDLMQENRQLHAAVSDAQRKCRLVGEGPAMQRVRELRNAVERSLLSCRGSRITPDDLPDRVRARVDPPTLAEGASLTDDSGLDDWLAQAERQRIIQALDQCQGVQVQAARVLGITERRLWYRLKKLDIRVDRAVRN